MPPLDTKTPLNDTPRSIRTSHRPKARRWDDHFNLESRFRGFSTLKKASKSISESGLLSLATGRPLPEYFPWYSLAIEDVASASHSRHKAPTSDRIRVKQGFEVNGNSALNISEALGYGDAAGASSLLGFITEHVEAIHRPPYADWKCSLTAGTTSAIDMCLRMFCERGDSLLTEEYTYPGTLEAVSPLGITPVGVAMDDEGLIPQRLDDILSSWDTKCHSKRKPRLLYTIPTGQNPTGSTQSFARRQAIYDIAEKHNLLIIEDDPYYYFHFQRPTSDRSIDEFLNGLPASYLSLDTSGRVLRLDSTSKILAPGLRCGWLTGPEQLVELFLALTEVSTISVSGVSQLFLSNLMCEKWGQTGFLEWLEHLSVEYEARRDKMLSALEQYLPREVCSWKTPDAGMFIWIAIWLGEESRSARMELEDRLFDRTVERGVAYSKGSWFRSSPPMQEQSEVLDPGLECVWLRLTYVATEAHEMETAVAVIGEAIRDVVLGK